MGHPPPAALKEWQYLRTGARNQKVSLDPMACNPPVSLDSMKLGSIYIHPELMGEVKLVKFTPYMVILDGGSVWKFWPYWQVASLLRILDPMPVCTHKNSKQNRGLTIPYILFS